MKRLRLLPLSIVAAILLLTLKVGDVWQSADALFGASTAIGAEHVSPPVDDAEDMAEEEDAGMELIERFVTPNVIDVSPTEIHMLENLLERRVELEKRESNVDMREKLLSATELRIDEKITELKAINANIASLIKQFDVREDKKITSLVKIYETMKAKDAARIFDQLELDILLLVLSRMREAKAAAVIAKMNANKARIVTTELAVRNSLPEIAAAAAKAAN